MAEKLMPRYDASPSGHHPQPLRAVQGKPNRSHLHKKPVAPIAAACCATQIVYRLSLLTRQRLFGAYAIHELYEDQYKAQPTMPTPPTAQAVAISKSSSLRASNNDKPRARSRPSSGKATKSGKVTKERTKAKASSPCLPSSVRTWLPPVSTPGYDGSPISIDEFRKEEKKKKEVAEEPEASNLAKARPDITSDKADARKSVISSPRNTEENGDGRHWPSLDVESEDLTQGVVLEPPESWYQDVNISKGAAIFLWWGLKPQTRSSYITKQYRDFCKLKGFQPQFPVIVAAIIEWVSSLGDKHVDIKTIRGYVNSVRLCNVAMGYEELDAFEDPCLDRIYEGIRRFHKANP
ncbi:MAG: hypothetical protein Q9171_007074 [Xanthocarpia ochracea]